jgi:hypothetical protein
MADNNALPVYQQLCASYQSSEEFRTKLLSFLPIVSGAGIFAFVQTNITDLFFVPIGLVGAALAFGLFLFELGGLYWRLALTYRGMELEATLAVNGQFSLQPGGKDQNNSQAACGYHMVRDSMWTSNRWGASVIYASVITAWLFTSYAGFARSMAHHAPFFSSPLAYGICIVLLFSLLTTVIYQTRMKKFKDAINRLDSNYEANLKRAREDAKQIKQNNSTSAGSIRALWPFSAAIAKNQTNVQGIAQAEKHQTPEGG